MTKTFALGDHVAILDHRSEQFPYAIVARIKTREYDGAKRILVRHPDNENIDTWCDPWDLESIEPQEPEEPVSPLIYYVEISVMLAMLVGFLVFLNWVSSWINGGGR